MDNIVRIFPQYWEFKSKKDHCKNISAISPGNILSALWMECLCNIAIEYIEQNCCPKDCLAIYWARLLQWDYFKYYFCILVKAKEDTIRRMFLKYCRIKSKKDILQKYWCNVVSQNVNHHYWWNVFAILH